MFSCCKPFQPTEISVKLIYFIKICKGGGLKLVPFYITLNNFGISLTAISCKTLNAVLDYIFSRDMSKLFLAKKTFQLNGNTFYYSLVAAFRFIMLTLLGTSFLIFDILR